jgi:nitrile hydratase accessory protein
MVEIPRHEGMPPLPLDAEGPVFNEPWEAQAFAIVLTLYQRQRFTWPEWVEVLSTEIKHGAASHSYYEHWLAALETLLVAKDLARQSELNARKADLEANPPDRHDHVARRDPIRVG